MPGFMDFYNLYDLRVRFYGNYRAALNKPIYAPVLEILGNISNRTSGHATHSLFFGLFADDATQQVGKLAVDFHLREQRIPERGELVSLYYGEYIEPATLFIGFEKPAVFDYPLLGLGNESLYFSVAPTPYLTEAGLRKILYDHLYQRTIKDPSWDQLPESEAQALREFYRREQDTSLGVGEIFHNTWIHQGDRP
jgi:hypothetical protein